MAYVTVNDSMNCSFDISHSARDITTKESSGDRYIGEGLKQGNFSLEGLVDGSGYDDTIEQAYLNRSSVGVKWNSGVVGDTEYEVNAYVTSFSRGANTEDNGTYSATFEITGSVSETVIT